MDSRTQQTLVQSLSLKVRRRICQRCRRGLEHAIVEVKVTNDAAQVGYTCANCGFQSGGLVQLSARIKREILGGKVPEPISYDEVALVRTVLANWHRPLTELIA